VIFFICSLVSLFGWENCEAIFFELDVCVFAWCLLPNFYGNDDVLTDITPINIMNSMPLKSMEVSSKSPWYFLILELIIDIQ